MSANHSLIGAHRATHLKIVVVGLLGAIMVVAVGITARAVDHQESTARVVLDARVVASGE